MKVFILMEQRDDCCQYWVNLAGFSTREKAEKAKEEFEKLNPEIYYDIDDVSLDQI